jgi:hypothetical protein
MINFSGAASTWVHVEEEDPAKSIRGYIVHKKFSSDDVSFVPDATRGVHFFDSIIFSWAHLCQVVKSLSGIRDSGTPIEYTWSLPSGTSPNSGALLLYCSRPRSLGPSTVEGARLDLELHETLFEEVGRTEEGREEGKKGGREEERKGGR